MASERDQLLIAVYQKQNNSAKLAETAWRVFRRDRSLDTFEVLLTAVGEEKRPSLLEEEANTILKAGEFHSGDAGFLIEAGRVDDAERYIIAQTENLNGRFYESLLVLAKEMLKHERLVASSVLYRALLDSILARGISKNYHHGVNYLKKLDTLAPRIHDWQNVESHTAYLANLREKHKLKSSFWKQCRAAT
jgi:hypothetical protein